MVFSDLFFLFAFLPAFLICYMLASLLDKKLAHDPLHPRFTARNIALVIFSLLFYSWGEPVYVFLMVISVAINYFVGRAICKSTTHRKQALIVGLVANIAIICSFKYLGFLAGILSSIGLGVPDPHIALPIGISFYTFQSISYLVDVYRNDSPAQERYVDLLLYISMFPQLIAGPIVRYGTVANEINNRRVSASDISDGAFRFLIGLGKKVIIANQLSEISDQFLATEGLENLSTTGAWLGIFAFTLQIYFDFSGYSDMAIGIGRCLGFHFCENFNHPYMSRTITEFWRRWHMSLGSFFRDYVYIPLGGNRAHQFLNILIVWALTGLWHGASWNFVLWGLFFAVILILEKTFILKFMNRLPRVVGIIYTMTLVAFGFTIFYFDDMQALREYYRAFFATNGNFSDFTVQSAIFDNFWLWITAIVFCFPVRDYVGRLHCRLLEPRHTNAAMALSTVWRIAMAVGILLLSITLLIGATNNAFLYTRF